MQNTISRVQTAMDRICSQFTLLTAAGRDASLSTHVQGRASAKRLLLTRRLLFLVAQAVTKACRPKPFCEPSYRLAPSHPSSITALIRAVQMHFAPLGRASACMCVAQPATQRRLVQMLFLSLPKPVLRVNKPLRRRSQPNT